MPSSSSTITYMPPVPDDPSRRRPDITRARSELNWEPRVPLREGLTRTIDYFREVTAA
jgi:nucleoside-diphosphate-sugar epimerase